MPVSLLSNRTSIRFRSQVISVARVKSESIYSETLLCFTQALTAAIGKTQMTRAHSTIIAAPRLVLLTLACLATGAAMAQGPSYDCSKVEAGSIEEMICQDEELSALDLELSGVYAEASVKAANEQPPILKAEQRGWIKGRDDCWKSDDQRKCVKDQYQLRIAELQARYRLVPGNGPFTFVCGSPGPEVIATFFQTKPPTLIAELGDSVSLMYQQPSASGAKYQGRNETFWEHHGEALVIWGYGAPEMHCKKSQ